MFDATVSGTLIHCKEDGVYLVGRLVTRDDINVQFSARRGFVKRAITELPHGMPVTLAGTLRTSVRTDKEGRPFVLHELLVSAVLTPKPLGLLASIL